MPVALVQLHLCLDCLSYRSKTVCSFVSEIVVGYWLGYCYYLCCLLVTVCLCLQGYKNPLSGRLLLTNEGQKVVQAIFSNVEDLYSLHRCEGVRV